jgi:hypothetical protein
MPSEPTVLGYEPQKPRRRVYRIIAPLVVLAIVLALIWSLLPRLSRVRSTPGWYYSYIHLKEIGEMCQIYAIENQDRLPDNLGILTTTEDVLPQTLQSPYSQYPTTAPSSQPTDLVLWANQHCDYVYLGAGKLASKLTRKDVLGHETWSIAKQQGTMNILFGDGYVQWYNLNDAAKILNRNPSTAPTP